MTTNPSNTRKATPKAAAKKPAVKRAAKSNVVQLDAAVAKISRKRAAKAVDADTPEIEPTHRANAGSLTDVQIATLAQLHDELLTATEAFETAVVQLLQDGRSPSHVGKASAWATARSAGSAGAAVGRQVSAAGALVGLIFGVAFALLVLGLVATFVTHIVWDTIAKLRVRDAKRAARTLIT